jgi:diguanylate cyclase (GGDEF)-like protein
LTGLWLLFALPVLAETSTPSVQQKKLVLGIFAFRDIELIKQRYLPLAEYLSTALEDYQVELQVLPEKQIWDALQRHELDFVLTNPVNYVALREHNAMSGALATLVTRSGDVSVNALGGVMFHKQGMQTILSLQDLEGLKVAITGREYLGGYLAPTMQLKEAGVRASKITWITVGQPHDRVVDAVLSGQADVGFVRTGILEDLIERGKLAPDTLTPFNLQDMPGFPFRVSTRLYPEWPLVSLPQVEAPVARKVAAALLNLDAEHPAARSAGIAGFNVPADYMVIEKAMRRLQMAPFDQHPKVTLADIWNTWRLQLLVFLAATALVLLLLFLLVVLNRRLNISRLHLEKIAHYDLLTGLPNRHLLNERLQEARGRAQYQEKVLAVCYMDLDNFKQLNDRFGHVLGDELLLLLAERLHKQIHEKETLARVSGDEFVLLLTDARASDLEVRLNALMKEVRQPLVLSKTTAQISASLGVTLFPFDKADPDTLLRHADEAMYRAKALGKNRIDYFDADLNYEQQVRQGRLGRLREALLKEELLLYYQPKVDLRSHEVIGVEALIRWNHPEQGLLPPGVFLPDIDGSELEAPLGLWVLETALKQLDAWHQQGHSLAVSVNISASHLLHESFFPDLEGLLESHPQWMASKLEIEVLETAALGSLDVGRQVLEKCHQLGVQVSLDDFGTGYSSLAYFRNLPVDILKIDQSFVRDMLQDKEDRSIVESVVRLATAFNRQVIAEGVETSEHATELLKLGCFLAQGYGIARPMPAASLPDWLGEWQQSH